MPTISKKDLVDRIAEKTQSRRTAVKAVVQQLLDEITTDAWDALAGDIKRLKLT